MNGVGARTSQTGIGLPTGFRVEFDESAREIRRGVWFGGQPARVLRFSERGTLALDALRSGPVRNPIEADVARRLTDSGLAHPVPAPLPATPAVTVVVPVRDRPGELDRCLAALGPRFPVIVVDDGSRDQLGIRSVAAKHHATVVRHEVNTGPAAARNTGLGRVATEFVAFVDSDTCPGAEWIDELAAHLADPCLAAVAPRVTPRAGRTWAGRYTRARGTLDLGTVAARVVPYTRVSYVPSAALLARRSALAAVARAGDVFDPTLRVGEDVDLVWRLAAAGERVRFEPATRVPHREPRTWRGLLHRRFRYGTSAAHLAARHPGNVAPLVLYPWHAATAAALLARRPVLALAAGAVAVRTTARAVRRAGVPGDGVVTMTAGAVGQTLLGISRYAVQFGTPLLLTALARGSAGTRAAAALVLLAPGAHAWRGRRAELDPVRFVLGSLADDVAYGAGVVAGCVRQRTTAPLRPRLVRPSRRQEK